MEQQEHRLAEILKTRLNGGPKGIVSVCSANPYVIRAVFRQGKRRGAPVLIEATANQCNRFGGYTGMTPAAFRNFVYELAAREGFPVGNIILGGDHLGPLLWADHPEVEAMAQARELVRDYVLAGFTKIHLDTSMMLGDDEHNARLSFETVAERGAVLARACEDAFRALKAENLDAIHPVYVIGSEVPIPGGSHTTEDVAATSPEDLTRTMAAYRRAFEQAGVAGALSYIIAVVVQPGVEFGNNYVHLYSKEAAKPLTSALPPLAPLVFEGHSTDYQTKRSLREMAADGVAILKVGPELTYALREGLVALSHIEDWLIPAGRRSDFIKTLDAAMTNEPKHWRRYCGEDEREQAVLRLFGMSDRWRYYFSNAAVLSGVDKLVKNLSEVELPLPLLSQYLPAQYEKIREGALEKNPEACLLDKVADILEKYAFALDNA